MSSIKISSDTKTLVQNQTLEILNKDLYNVKWESLGANEGTPILATSPMNLQSTSEISPIKMKCNCSSHTPQKIGVFQM
jgi:hypothetical protein